MKNRAWIWIIAGFIGLTLVAIFVLPKLRPYTFHGTLIQSQDVSPDFTLTTQDGQAASLSDFRGKTVLLYFGYTFCPDVCPATLAEVNKALENLGKMAEDVQVIMVTVDPERDTPEKLSEYLKHFNPTFIGFTGSPQEIAETAALYGIYYGKQEGSDATDYLVDHTASLMVIDEGGHLKLIYPFGVPAQEIADDLAYMMK
ncbi:MAG: SCO family protein [Anaerolineales bacterium]|nr:SCO family protein [Anaerolineales bacterium]